MFTLEVGQSTIHTTNQNISCFFNNSKSTLLLGDSEHSVEVNIRHKFSQLGHGDESPRTGLVGKSCSVCNKATRHACKRWRHCRRWWIFAFLLCLVALILGFVSTNKNIILSLQLPKMLKEGLAVHRCLGNGADAGDENHFTDKAENSECEANIQSVPQVHDATRCDFSVTLSFGGPLTFGVKEAVGLEIKEENLTHRLLRGLGKRHIRTQLIFHEEGLIGLGNVQRAKETLWTQRYTHSELPPELVLGGEMEKLLAIGVRRVANLLPFTKVTLELLLNSSGCGLALRKRLLGFDSHN